MITEIRERYRLSAGLDLWVVPVADGGTEAFLRDVCWRWETFADELAESEAELPPEPHSQAGSEVPADAQVPRASRRDASGAARVRGPAGTGRELPLAAGAVGAAPGGETAEGKADAAEHPAPRYSLPTQSPSLPTQSRSLPAQSHGLQRSSAASRPPASGGKDSAAGRRRPSAATEALDEPPTSEPEGECAPRRARDRDGITARPRVPETRPGVSGSTGSTAVSGGPDAAPWGSPARPVGRGPSGAALRGGDEGGVPSSAGAPRSGNVSTHAARGREVESPDRIEHGPSVPPRTRPIPDGTLAMAWRRRRAEDEILGNEGVMVVEDVVPEEAEAASGDDGAARRASLQEWRKRGF